jgi:epoxyqueuosine reductase
MLTADLVRERALEYGFDLVGFAPAGPTPNAQAFVEWLEAGYAGEMDYLAREPHKRIDPRNVLASARTIVIVGVSYETLAMPYEILQDPSRGRIARYAWGADYHDAITPALREFGEWIARESRAYVDTGPVLERAWAERGGLGFIGKNTCLIHRDRGSHLFLGAVLVACPTNAFPQPGVLDARRCISYLTIELKGSVPLELRPLMGNWIFGCDICQDVCPYVRRYSRPTKTKLGQSFYPPDIDRAAPKLIDVLQMDRAAFNARFKDTAIMRAKRRGLVRSACVATGNWESSEALPALRRLLDDEEPLIREHARWAIDKIGLWC